MDVGTAITSAFSAGISMYGVLALLGIAGRLDWIEGPDSSSAWSSSCSWCCSWWSWSWTRSPTWTPWDAVHTVLRPAAGAATMAIAPDQTLPVPVALAIGGALALTSHSAKAATRALVNTSPEPVSNVVVSTAEDGLVAVIMALAIANPEVAAAITAVLVVLALGVILAARHAVRSLRRRWKARKAEKRSGDGPSPPGAGPPRR